MSDPIEEVWAVGFFACLILSVPATVIIVYLQYPEIFMAVVGILAYLLVVTAVVITVPLLVGKITIVSLDWWQQNHD